MNYCCETMRGHCEHHCPVHGGICPERVVARTNDGDFVLPIRDGGFSGVDIRFCPWCGTELSQVIEEGIAEFERLLRDNSPGNPERSIKFGRLTMGGKPLVAEGSWLLAEVHAGQMTQMIALNTTEAQDLHQQMLEQLG